MLAVRARVVTAGGQPEAAHVLQVQTSGLGYPTCSQANRSTEGSKAMTITHRGVSYYVWDAHDLWALCFTLKLQQGAA